MRVVEAGGQWPLNVVGDAMTSLTVVWAIDGGDAVTPTWLGGLHGSSKHTVIDIGKVDRAADFAGTAVGCAYLHRPGLAWTEAWNLGLRHASTRWLVFQSGLMPLPLAALHGLLAELDASVAMGMVVGAESSGRSRIDALEAMPPARRVLAYCRARLLASEVLFDSRLRTDFAPIALMAAYLQTQASADIAWVGEAPGHWQAQALMDEPSAAAWADRATYDETLRHGHLALLRAADGAAPRWLQGLLLGDLQWYYTVDARERAPTVVVDEPLSQRFHALATEILALVDARAIDALLDRGTAEEVIRALHAYRAAAPSTQFRLDAFDHAQGLVRLRYHWHGPAPAETFMVDGHAVQPVHGKWRCCRFFQRVLLSERIVWLPIRGGRKLSLKLDGQALPVQTASPHGHALLPVSPAVEPLDLEALGKRFNPGQGGAHKPAAAWPWLKAAVLRSLAALASLRPGFARAWIFIDRDVDADDNAEHLYRWVTKNRPQHNAWFLIRADSPDWARLKAEGFRLIAPGRWSRLLYLNAQHVVSSHLDPALGGFAPAVHGPLMRWRFTFLQHGVTKDDMSHWFNGQPMDLLVTCTPDEHASIVDDQTPYVLTTREARRTGFPRHDALLALSRSLPANAVDTLMVMPTWRGNLVQADDPDPMASFRQSEYAQRWRSLLGSEGLRAVAAAHGLRIVFMPHPNAVPYLRAFDLPAHVQVLTKADIRIQELMCRSAVMVTDYSSIVFEMACLHRPVLYYQYDRARFYGGDHNWRPGYFETARHGFGPMLTVEQQLVDELAAVLANDRRPAPIYLDRMERAFPDRDGRACQRTYEAMLALDDPQAAMPSDR